VQNRKKQRAAKAARCFLPQKIKKSSHPQRAQVLHVAPQGSHKITVLVVRHLEFRTNLLDNAADGGIMYVADVGEQMVLHLKVQAA
jgi:Holliday junction resolvase-like predicted endonuclease